jgi:septum formation protein
MALHEQRIYLASASPRRRELLKQIGVHFEMIMLRTHPSRAAFDETPLPAENPRDYVLRIANIKAEMGHTALHMRRLPPYPLLAADTTVTIDGEIIGKPSDMAQAVETLRRLSGKRHEVHTAIALAYGGDVKTKVSSSIVEFAPLDEHTIKNYTITGEPHDKAGAYAIQGRAAAFISRLEGSYSGVMGLPLYETVELLGQFGIDVL